jgi:O-antigen/teichoic acid export membrane protein
MTAAVPQHNSALKEIQTVVRHTSVYGVGNIIAKVLGFLLLPVYTRYLNPRDYGLLEILDLSMSLFGMFLAMGLGPALLRSYAAADSEQEKRSVLSTGFLFAAVTGLATFCLGVGFIGPVSSIVLGPDVPSKYLLLAFIAFALSYIAAPTRFYFRALEASGTLVFVDTISSFCILGLNILFIAGLKIGPAGILWSSILADVGWMVLWAVVFYRIGFHYSRSHLRELLRFGLPLIFSNLAMFVLNFADRFFLQHLRSLEVVGLYAVGYKFGFMVNYLFVQPFVVMWQSRMYAIESHPEANAIFAQIFALYSALLTWVALGLALLTPEILRLMVDAKFFGAGSVAPVVGLAYVVCGVGLYVQTGMFLAGRTKLIGVISAVTAPLSLGINYVLIKYFGMAGGAWATLISFLIIGAGSYWFSQRVHPLGLPIRRVALTMALATALYLAGSRLSVRSSVDVPLKLAMLGAFPVMLWQFRIVSHAEKAILRAARDKARGKLARYAGAALRRSEPVMLRQPRYPRRDGGST